MTEQTPSQPAAPPVSGQLEYIAAKFHSLEFIRNQISLHERMVAQHQREVATWRIVLNAMTGPPPKTSRTAKPTQPKERPQHKQARVIQTKTTRGDITEFLREHGPSSASEIAKGTGRPINTVHVVCRRMRGKEIERAGARTWRLIPSNDGGQQ